MSALPRCCRCDQHCPSWESTAEGPVCLTCVVKERDGLRAAVARQSAAASEMFEILEGAGEVTGSGHDRARRIVAERDRLRTELADQIRRNDKLWLEGNSQRTEQLRVELERLRADRESAEGEAERLRAEVERTERDLTGWIRVAGKVQLERDEARHRARLLAHAFEHDTRPPGELVRLSLLYPAIPTSAVVSSGDNQPANLHHDNVVPARVVEAIQQRIEEARLGPPEPKGAA